MRSHFIILPQPLGGGKLEVQRGKIKKVWKGKRGRENTGEKGGQEKKGRNREKKEGNNLKKGDKEGKMVKGSTKELK